MAKVPNEGQPLKYDYLKQQEFFANQIGKHLTDYAVKQELVVLRDTNIVERLNDYLRGMDSTRKKKFQGTFVGETDWGILVEDMRPESKFGSMCSSTIADDATIIKPKIPVANDIWSSSSLNGSFNRPALLRRPLDAASAPWTFTTSST